MKFRKRRFIGRKIFNYNNWFARQILWIKSWPRVKSKNFTKNKDQSIKLKLQRILGVEGLNPTWPVEQVVSKKIPLSVKKELWVKYTVS